MIQINIHKKLHGSQGNMHLDVNLEIQEGEFIALMGASGSGKTTLLRVLAGLEKAEGEISVDNIHWLKKHKDAASSTKRDRVCISRLCFI